MKTTYDHSLVYVSGGVRNMTRRGQPVVALESVVLTHGLPHPANLTLARDLEQIVSARGALAATVGVLRGQPIVGLTSDQISTLITSPLVSKVSLRDLPTVVSAQLDGATTVASTLFLANRAGIKVMCTGGIGGVHRGAEITMDISADLPTLASTPMVVVCAGPKTLVDAHLTMEWLETNGVPVIGYGTDTVPLFYLPDSHLPVSHRVNTAEEVASLARASWRLGLHSAVLVVVPVPLDAALEATELNRSIDTALREADERGVSGAELTPFVLARLRELTAGRTLDANLALLRNNAAIAADIAAALAETIA